MSSDSERDMIDYIDDDAHHEDETLFIPAPDGRPDNWTAFYIGILTGIVGGGLVALAPRLGGILIVAGYGLTAFTLKARGNRFARALRFGFLVSAVLGAALVAGEIYCPNTVWQFIAVASERHLIFTSVVAFPWATGMLRYVYALVRREKRLGQVVMVKRVIV